MNRRQLLCTVTLVNGLRAAEIWNEKKAVEWTAQDRERILTRSPWAKTVTASLDFSGMPMGPPPGGGGPPGGGPPGGGPPGGGPGGGGPGGGGPPPGMGGGMPEMKAVVRWESAAPVRDARAQALPEETAGHLVISVSGMPRGPQGRRRNAEALPNMDEDLLEATTLKPKGKKALRPVRFLRDEKSGGILFLFGEPAETISADDKEWVFETRLGPMELKAKFAAKEMRYLGKLAI